MQTQTFLSFPIHFSLLEVFDLSFCSRILSASRSFARTHQVKIDSFDCACWTEKLLRGIPILLGKAQTNPDCHGHRASCIFRWKAWYFSQSLGHQVSCLLFYCVKTVWQGRADANLKFLLLQKYKAQWRRLGSQLQQPVANAKNVLLACIYKSEKQAYF